MFPAKARLPIALDVSQAHGHRHYWVRDPMGTTLEIYAAPA